MADIASPPAAAGPAGRHHFTAWRWHFYAALYVIPFMIVLAASGLVMLWIAVLSDINGEKTRVAATGSPLPVSTLQAAAEAAVPDGRAMQYIEPLAPGRVAAFRVVAGDVGTTVLVDPYSAEVVDSFPWGKGWYDVMTRIHGTLLVGDLGDRLIEIAASLGILLVATGLYLHWPRGRTGWRRVLLPAFAARGRSLWKSLHGVTGFWMSLVMLVFLVSGLSWAGIWGGRMVQAWNTFPAEKWESVPLSDKTHASMDHGAAKEVPWNLEQTPLPASGSLAGHLAVPPPVDTDAVVAFARALGFAGRFQVNMPDGEDGVWTVSHDSMSNDGHDPGGDRTIHIDRYTGNVLADIRYADYSPYAKMMAWGIAFHEGDLGAWNVALDTAFCLAMIFLPVSGLVMWWKRRPGKAGRLGAPPRPAEAQFWTGAAILVVALGLAFPLGGAVVLAVVLADRFILRHLPAMRRALG
ncbi:MAG: PepSY domain-containing protein [Rhodobacteraceae bacterium]|nr:PepSY domain-containing protein [Paracoccaceae bacterium]